MRDRWELSTRLKSVQNGRDHLNHQPRRALLWLANPGDPELRLWQNKVFKNPLFFPFGGTSPELPSWSNTLYMFYFISSLWTYEFSECASWNQHNEKMLHSFWIMHWKGNMAFLLYHAPPSMNQMVTPIKHLFAQSLLCRRTGSFWQQKSVLHHHRHHHYHRLRCSDCWTKSTIPINISTRLSFMSH